MDSNKLTLLINGFSSLLRMFEEPLFLAFGAMIAFALAFGIKRIVLE